MYNEEQFLFLVVVTQVLPNNEEKYVRILTNSTNFTLRMQFAKANCADVMETAKLTIKRILEK